MPRRLPLTVWLYIAADMWKLILLTAAVLVTVIAFGAGVKPLADGRLGPLQTIYFMLLAMPPMLQYALPFAACFGATLSYHRMAADNEMTACYAGGISHRSLLVPALVSGLVLSGVLLQLSNYTIPWFLQKMAEQLSEDATKLITSTIERGEALEMDDALVYADKVVALGPEEKSGSFERLWLKSPIIVRMDAKEAPDRVISAPEAIIKMRKTFAPGGGDRSATEVIPLFRDARIIGNGAKAELAGTVPPMTVPNAFSDNPKFLSFSELRALREVPERMDWIDKHKRTLALSLAQRDAVDTLRQSLKTTRQVELRDGLGQKIILHANDVRPARRVGGGRDPNVMQVFPTQRGQPVVVERTMQDKTVQRQSANIAILRFQPAGGGGGSPATGMGSMIPSGPAGGDSAGTRVLMTLQLKDVAAERINPEGEFDVPEDQANAAPGEVPDRPMTDLSLPQDPSGEILAMKTSSLIQAAGARAKQTPIDGEALNPPLGMLTFKVRDLMREVVSKEQERLAMCVACLVMVLTGAVMAMRLRDSLPLTIYLWAFFPALASVLTISGGQQVVHGHGMWGLPVLWCGVAGLGMYTFLEFGRLARH